MRERGSVDVEIKKSDDVAKLLQQEYHGVTVADRIVKMILEEPRTGEFLHLGDLSRFLLCFPDDAGSEDFHEQRT